MGTLNDTRRDDVNEDPLGGDGKCLWEAAWQWVTTKIPRQGTHSFKRIIHMARSNINDVVEEKSGSSYGPQWWREPKCRLEWHKARPCEYPLGGNGERLWEALGTASHVVSTVTRHPRLWGDSPRPYGEVEWQTRLDMIVETKGNWKILHSQSVLIWGRGWSCLGSARSGWPM